MERVEGARSTVAGVEVVVPLELPPPPPHPESPKLNSNVSNSPTRPD
jgi:hypothetical protein